MFYCDDAIVAVNKFCSPQWNVTHNAIASDYFVTHRTANMSLQLCQKACLFDPQCVAVAYGFRCRLYRNKVTTLSTSSNQDMYKLVKRCAITAGSYFVDIRCFVLYILLEFMTCPLYFDKLSELNNKLLRILQNINQYELMFRTSMSNTVQQVILNPSS